MLHVRKTTSVGKILALERSNKLQNYSKALNLSKSNMAAAELLEELKSMYNPIHLLCMQND